MQLILINLKQNEYQTSLIGKWHLGLETENHPCRRGFDHFHGFLGDMVNIGIERGDYNYRLKRHESCRLEGKPILKKINKEWLW